MPLLPERTSTLQHRFLRLFSWPMLLFWLLEVILTYGACNYYVQKVLINNLIDTASVVGSRVYFQNNIAHLKLSPQAHKLVTYDSQNSVTYELVGPDQPFLFNKCEKNNTFTFKLNKETFQAVCNKVTNNNSYVYVLLKESTKGFNQMMEHILIVIMLPQIFLGIVGYIWLRSSIGKGLQPIAELTQEIEHLPLTHDSLLPKISQNPREISLLRNVINNLLQLLHRQWQHNHFFMAVASHQLKTPLAGIKIHIEKLLKQNDPEVIQKTLQELHQQTDRSIRRLQQLLAYTNAQLKEIEGLNWQNTNINEIAHQLIEDFILQALHKDIDLGLVSDDPNHVVHTVPEILYEALSNLIDNALKYCPSHSQITLSIINAKNNSYLIQIIDNGLGIPQLLIDELLADRPLPLNRIEGQGLGLRAVKKFIELINGTLTVQSNENGTTFSILLTR